MTRRKLPQYIDEKGILFLDEDGGLILRGKRRSLEEIFGERGTWEGTDYNPLVFNVWLIFKSFITLFLFDF